MRIILCDDDHLFLQRLRKLIEDYLTHRGIPCIIRCYTSGIQLLSRSEFQFDLVFLDIRMDELDGIEVAKILRERNPHFALVFVSAFLEYAPEGYVANALRYLIKDKLDMLFEDTMDAVLDDRGIHKTEITVDFVGSGSEMIYTDDILYLESKLHVVYYHLAGSKQSKYIYGKLDAIQDMLPPDEFMRIHKSYLTNLRHLREVRNYTAFLAGEFELPISQRHYNEVRKTFLMYKGKI